MDRRAFIGVLAAIGTAAATPDILRAERVPNGTALEVLTRTIFNDAFSSVNHADDIVARQLFPLSLQEAYTQGIIPRYATDFLMPLGVKDGERTIDFVRGMRDMWNDKPGINAKRGLGPSLRARRDHFVAEQKASLPSNLRSYRRHDIQHGITALHAVHDGRSRAYAPGIKPFMDSIVDTISPNVLLGYNMQELLPPRIQGRSVNAVAKTWFLDRLLKEGGMNVIEGYPARYDRVMSYGPFQMTDIPMAIIQARNRYLPATSRVPRTVASFNSMADHVNAAVMLAHGNWEWIGGYLKRHTDRQKKNLLTKFQDRFGDLGEKERQIIVAGITACMHHLPGATVRTMANYVDRSDMDQMHWKIKQTLGPQLRKYYDSSAEAYLMMKVFHEHEQRFSPK